MKFASTVAKLLGRKNPNDVPHRIYGTVVAQARKSVFYTEFNIPDTVMGRYDMLALHVFLLSYRLKNNISGELEGSKELSQDIFDIFLIDLERGLRDLGFADTSVHKRKKRLARSYYALIEDFDAALTKVDTKKLALAVVNRYFEKMSARESAKAGRKLAEYMLLLTNNLSKQSMHAIMDGKLEWPDIAGNEL